MLLSYVFLVLICLGFEIFYSLLTLMPKQLIRNTETYDCTVPKWCLGDGFYVVATQCEPRESRKVFGDIEGEHGQEVVGQAEGKYRGW